MPPTPLDPALYARVKAEADRLFLKSSAYKSGWMVKTYKDRGGKYKPEDKPRNAPTTGLKRWFKEKWVDLNRNEQPCGRAKASLKGTYPLCRPSIRVNKLSPRTPEELSRQEIANAKKEKQRIKEKGNIRFVTKV